MIHSLYTRLLIAASPLSQMPTTYWIPKLQKTFLSFAL